MGRSAAVLDDIEAFIPRLRRYTRLFVGNADLADDLVAECLSIAVGRLGSLKWEDDLLLWLLSIQQRVILDREYYLSALKADVVSGGLGNGAARSSPPQTLPDATASALLHLLPTERAALLLVVVEGLSYDDAAQLLGIGAAEVPSLLSKARGSLDKIVQAVDGGKARQPSQPALS